MLAACLLDRLVGDPRAWLHPVQVIGWGIALMRRLWEPLAAGRPWALRCVGALITLVAVGLSASLGWLLERWLLASMPPASLSFPGFSSSGFGAGGVPDLLRPLMAWPGSVCSAAGFVPPLLIMVVALASALAGRSLEQAVGQVLQALPQAAHADLSEARQRLSWIVGRDVDQLEASGILRACAETASENAVDGLFGPLFWMLCGVLFWHIPGAPGPLSLAWAFKAASTLDSMLGYRRGSLLWLGTAGARLDDVLTWLPCRLVALSLPLVGRHPGRFLSLARLALRQGAADPSPNAGVSQAIYALLLGLQLGGESLYGGQRRHKPLVGVCVSDVGAVPISAAAVEAMFSFSRRLQLLWLIVPGLPVLVPCITKTLS